LLAILFAAAALCLFGSALTRAYADEQQAPPGDPARGKSVFEKNCVPCHKQDGTGGIKLIATGNPSRNFRDPVFWKDRTDAQIQHSIETGFPKSGMVSWKGVLKPQEIRNVIAYLRFKFQPKGTAAAAAAPAAGKTEKK
jgi:mono/diheme cytochrome c family protein